MNVWWRHGAAASMVALLAVGMAACDAPEPITPAAPPAVGALAVGAATLEAVLDEAIQDEYKAYWRYAAVVEDFGEVQPFLNIRPAEERHFDAIAGLYEKRGWPVPASEWSLENAPRYPTLLEACEAGVEKEIENREMYDRLLTQPLPGDVRNVFGKLRSASDDQHLPAFERCAGGSAS